MEETIKDILKRVKALENIIVERDIPFSLEHEERRALRDCYYELDALVGEDEAERILFDDLNASVDVAI